MEERALSMLKKVMIPGVWKIYKEVSITKFHLDCVEYAMEEQESIPGGWNSQVEANNTQWDSCRVERMRRRKK